MRNLKRRKWYPYAVAACIAVVLFVALTNLQAVLNALGAFIGFFKPLILGCIVAYIVNPLSVFMEKTVFKWVKKDKRRRSLSVMLTFLIVVAFLIFFVVSLIPQLITSVRTFLANADGYFDSVKAWMESKGFSPEKLGLDKIESVSETIMSMISDNSSAILKTTVNVGSGVMRWAIALILSLYLLLEKDTLRNGCARIIRAYSGEDRYGEITVFLSKCNLVFNHYIVYNIIDSLIIGAVNAIVMAIIGMQYVGLITFVVAVTNLIPTFGPLIGGVFGAFILLLVNPLHALIFLILTVVLQICDGYVIKPKLFGSSLGVSGLWILVGVLVGGNMFGIVGILISIPVVAIIDFLYRHYIVPELERRLKTPAHRAEDEHTEAEHPEVEGTSSDD